MVISGMVLPFIPLALTFRDMHYYVALPKVDYTCICSVVWNCSHLCMYP